MINGQTILGIIPARGGSKGLPGKHERELEGKPLLAWTIDAALKSSHLDRVILSSDSESIIETARTYGCEVPFVRDSNLATDSTPMMDVVFDAIQRCPGYEWTMLLQPTSPLRTVQDIDNAIQYCLDHRSSSCVSVSLVQKNPHWMYTLDQDGLMHSLFTETETATRRQDLPAYYALNGAIYFAQTEWLIRNRQFLSPETLAYVMPVERSADIDAELDFLYIQTIIDSMK